MTYFSNTEYEYTSILAACLIFAGWGFIHWNCYAKLSNQSGGSYSIENMKRLFLNWISFSKDVYGGLYFEILFFIVFCPE